MSCRVVTFTYHFGGRWVFTGGLEYIGGREKTEKGDADFLSFPHMLRKYAEKFDMPNLSKLCYLKPGKSLFDDGVLVLENDRGINDIRASISMLEVNCEAYVHIYPFDEIVVKEHQLGTQFSSNPGMSISFEFGPTLREVGLCNDKNEAKLDDKGKHVEQDHVITENDDELEGKAYGDSSSSSSEGDSNNSSSSDDSDCGSDVEMSLIEQSKRCVNYDVNDGNPFFLLGMTFPDAKEARVAIAKYSIAKRTPLKLSPNEKHRIRAKCKTTGCPFELFLSQSGNTPNLVVKKFISDHDCLMDTINSFATSKLLATELKGDIIEKPTITTSELMKIIQNKLHLYVSRTTCKRAKRIVKTELDSSYIYQFGQIGAYVDLLKSTNPGSTIELQPCDEALQSGRLVFKRLYLCFDALKRGWKKGCRPMLGIDGCHLKGIVKGQILVAVGKDALEQIFPIAWAVIDKENSYNWRWFLELLVKDLEITGRGKRITIISDMQKGLINAVHEVLPLAEHRYCARHIESNWSKVWNSGELKKKFWDCVKSTFKEEFDDNLKSLGEISKQAAEDFVSYNSQTFCQAFFSTRCKSDTAVNNFCEAFNASIKNARFKPIISMLEDIREAAMARLASHRGCHEKWRTIWSDKCLEVYEKNYEYSFGCPVLGNGEDGYEIGDFHNKHTVMLDQQICTCRKWDLTGIPCPHAICALRHAKKDPKIYISSWYEKSAYEATYEVAMMCVPTYKLKYTVGVELYEPPPVVKLTGRPRVKRIRSKGESRKGQRSGKLGKMGVIMKCSICRMEGHNKTRCPQKEKDQGPGENTAEKGIDKGKKKVVSSGKGKEKVLSTRTEKRKTTNSLPNSCTMRKKRVVGMGLYIDDSSGNTSFNPGMSSEIVITQRDPIASQQSFVSSGSASRKIAFAATDTCSILPTNLLFNPLGPKWKGQPCTTRSQLEKERDKKKYKN